MRRCTICGVFGFVATGDRDPDLAQLKRIARTTMRRGPHAFGFSWIDRKGRLKMFKRTGKIADHLGLLNMARDARMLVGHCRYATHGAPEDNLNNHPHPADGGWVVHNGVVHDYEELVRRYGFHPVSRCDSEVLGLLLERTEGPMLDRCRSAVRATRRGPLVMLGLWRHPRRLVAVRQGNPLHVGVEREGYYLGSLSDDLPGEVAEVADDTAIEFSRTGMHHVQL